MKWKFIRVHLMQEESTKDLCLIEDEEKKPVCSFNQDISDLEGRMMANAPQMYDSIKEFIGKVNHGKF